MKNHNLVAISVLCGVLIGLGVSYALFSQRVSGTAEILSSQKQMVMNFAYEIPSLIDTARTVSEGNIDEFYRLTCLKVSLELESIESDVGPKYRNHEKVKRAIEMAKNYLSDMKASSKCTNV